MLPGNASTLLLAAGLAALVWLLLRRNGLSNASGQSADQRPSLHRSQFRIQNSEPPDLLRWQVEMHDTARELKGQLDCKLAALQALVALARRESDRLEAAIRRAEERELSASLRADNAAPADTLAQLAALADAAALANPAALAAAASLASFPGGIEENLFDTNRRSLDLAHLADQGLSPAEISHRLSLPLGEVELLLSLRSA